MPSKKPFVGVNMDEDVLRHVDDFRYNNRISSRAKAFDIILRAGMDALKDQYPELDMSVQLETGKKAKVDVVIESQRVR